MTEQPEETPEEPEEPRRAGAKHDTGFVNVLGIPLSKLFELTKLDDSALSNTLRRLQSEIDNPDEAVAGHQSAI